jgi:hypothetical protein
MHEPSSPEFGRMLTQLRDDNVLVHRVILAQLFRCTQGTPSIISAATAKICQAPDPKTEVITPDCKRLTNQTTPTKLALFHPQPDILNI